MTDDDEIILVLLIKVPDSFSCISMIINGVVNDGDI